ncbi:helix-turn-helix domain-containing protein [Streptomyces sp. NPDC004069]
MPTDPLPDWVLTRRRVIGDRVRTARKARRVSQEKLGEITGLDRKTINRIERGTHATLIDHLLLIARALDTPLRDLVD